MMRRWALLGAAALVAMGAAYWWSIDKASLASATPNTSRVPTPARVAASADSSVPLAALADPAVPPEKKVRRVHELLQTYSLAMKSRDRAPLADNADFVRALSGSNILGVVFLPPDHPSISRQGELLDAWQSPYFFHALAADSWEVVSAGPDRIRFNEDDLIFPPNPGRNPQSLAGEGVVGAKGN